MRFLIIATLLLGGCANMPVGAPVGGGFYNHKLNNPPCKAPCYKDDGIVRQIEARKEQYLSNRLFDCYTYRGFGAISCLEENLAFREAWERWENE